MTEQNSHLLMVGKMVSMNWNENNARKTMDQFRKKRIPAKIQCLFQKLVLPNFSIWVVDKFL